MRDTKVLTLGEVKHIATAAEEAAQDMAALAGQWEVA